MIPFLIAATLSSSPIWYEGRLLCPFYCTKTWVCDYVPCKDEAKAQKLCAVKACPGRRP